MSVGNVTQSICFDDKDLVLVLGENLDQGGLDSRNGVGKSTIVNALSYAFFGTALTNIRKDNLINKTNAKQMVVTLEFEKDGIEYLIERGRRPNKFGFMVAGTAASVDDADEAQGDSRVTQQTLERQLGLSHTMFKNIVALNTYSEPFLAMKAADQRDLIEQLLGITKLSEKAELLKERLRETKDRLKEEDFRIQAVKETNKRIEDNISGLKLKSESWEKTQETLIQDTREAIKVLEGIDVEEEIENHKLIASIKEVKSEYDKLESTRKQQARMIKALNESLTKAKNNLVSINDQMCHTCGQDLHDAAHERLEKETLTKIEELTADLKEKEAKLKEVVEQQDQHVVAAMPETFYDELEDAYNHRSSLDSLRATLEAERGRENHFIDQITNMQDSGIQVIDYTTVNNLTSLRDHQDFLLRLLTSKDSFIRKRIINQNLAYLNARLEYYLGRVGLPHKVKFMSDLTVEIREHGRDLDFDNLSRGERTRLILGLSWSFRDVYESLNTPISLLFIDELIDNGLDPAGVESALSVLKQMAREANRNIFLISHRDELVGRVGSVLKVIKESGFSSFEVAEDEGSIH